MEMQEVSMPFPATGTSKTTPRRRGFYGYGPAPTYSHSLGINSSLPDALFNDCDPFKINKHEKPIHRVMVSMALQGYTQPEIAAATGRHANTVRYTLRQPHARRYMIEHAKRDVSTEIRDFLEGEVLENLRVMKAIRDDPNVKAETRLLAADKLTDRQLGRPNQPFSLPAGGKPVSQMSLAEIDEALKQQGVNATAGTSAGSETPQDNSEQPV